MRNLSTEQVRLLRLRSQRLHPETARSISSVARLIKEICGLQAQELPSAVLAARPRSTDLVADDVKKAREGDRSIVLTWCMRGTIHLVPVDDLSWLLAFLGPIFIHKSQRRYKQLGLDPETRMRAKKVIRDVLSRRGPLTRPELAEALAEKRIPVEGQAIAHLVRYAALEGVICFGPEREGELTYVNLEDWTQLEGQLDQGRALAELARRYLQAYGPATPGDFASWSGISIGQARDGFEAISNQLLEVAAMDAPAWMLKRYSDWIDEPRDEAGLHLLPRYDAYLLGYRSRDFMVSLSYARRIHPGGGIIRQSVIADGRAIGLWRRERKKDRSIIVIELFEASGEDIMPDLESEVQDIGRFLEVRTELHIEN
ncbi:MAG TPA: winged helix DNA-binding domain-containing protein [Anaerolineales bacterium]